MRRANPKNIHQAKRAGVRGRMVSSWHVDEATADRVLDEWDAEAAGRGLNRDDGRNWTEGEVWMQERLG